MSDKPHKERETAAFWTANKPCEEALQDLSDAYNILADEVERLWPLEEQLEALDELVSDLISRQTNEELAFERLTAIRQGSNPAKERP